LSGFPVSRRYPRSGGASAPRFSDEDLDSILSWALNGSFTAFDFETTGLDAVAERVVEIGAVRFALAESEDGFQARPEKEFSRLVHPGKPIPAVTSAIHGIFDLDVSSAPSFRSIAPELLAFLAPTKLIAHNAPFDLGFLGVECFRAGIPFPDCPAFGGGKPSAYDTRLLAKAAVPGLGSYSLGALAGSFGITQTAAHRGGDDARVCMELFARCVSVLTRKAGSLRS